LYKGQAGIVMFIENGEYAMKKIMFLAIFLLGANAAFAKT
jgi:hypothetical protein